VHSLIWSARELIPYWVLGLRSNWLNQTVSRVMKEKLNGLSTGEISGKFFLKYLLKENRSPTKSLMSGFFNYLQLHIKN
jgi:hypothetical protein